MYKYSVDIFASLLNFEFTFVKTATFFFFRITGCLKLDIKIAKCRDFPDYIFLVINDYYPPPKKKPKKSNTQLLFIYFIHNKLYENKCNSMKIFCSDQRGLWHISFKKKTNIKKWVLFKPFMGNNQSMERDEITTNILEKFHNQLNNSCHSCWEKKCQIYQCINISF